MGWGARGMIENDVEGEKSFLSFGFFHLKVAMAIRI
jgi:hypothetical protein